MKTKQFFVDATKSEEVQLLLLSKKIAFTTQKFVFSLGTLAISIGVAIVIGLLVGLIA